MIEGVGIRDLSVFADDRGAVMHVLKSKWPEFQGFGEIYLSIVNPGVIKGWKRHWEMSMNLACPSGAIQLGLIDDRADSPTHGQTQSIEISPDHYKLITVPPGIWTGFKGQADTPSILINCASIQHDPAEAENRPIGEPVVAFDWQT